MQGGFGQAFGGLASGREQDVRHPTLFEELDRDRHAGRLAHSWTAADDRHLTDQRRRDGTSRQSRCRQALGVEQHAAIDTYVVAGEIA